MSNSAKLPVFEFSDHVRVALQQVSLIGSLSASPDCVLHIRRDCEEFVPLSPGCAIRYSNKYLMMARFFCEAVVLGRKVVVTTGPESSSRAVKWAFGVLLKIFKNQVSIFLIVRDSKPERGQYLMDAALYSSRSVLAVESEALLLSARKAGFAPGGYMYPTPIVSPEASRTRMSSSSDAGQLKRLKILITGSLDSERRNYQTFLEALDILRRSNVPLEVVIGGHCMTKSAPELLKELRAHCDDLVSKDLLTDAELDAALASADAIVCLNRPEYYASVKGSGAIGDAFFAGKKLLIHVDLVRPESADSQFYMPFSSGGELGEHLLKSHADRGHLRVEQSVLDRQAQYFSRLIGDWLAR